MLKRMSNAVDIVTVIERAKLESEFWTLLDKSKAQGGPFDGGCLICAKALLSFIGRGHIVRIWNEGKGDTEHYGLWVDTKIYDFDGVYGSSQEWLRHFAREEKVPYRMLSLFTGVDNRADIVSDEDAEARLVELLHRMHG